MWTKDTVYSDLICPRFVFELAKRGAVRVLSNQVTVESDGRGGAKLDGLTLPPHAHLEWMGEGEGGRACLTFVFERRA